MEVRVLVLVICASAAVTYSKSDTFLPGYFKYTISNKLQQPYFEESMLLKISVGEPIPFIRYMEESVIINPTKFKSFTGNFTSPYGYYIESINGVAGNWAVNKTYWQISNSSGPLDVGVSTYIPASGDRILFKLVRFRCVSSAGKLLFSPKNGKC